jgi:hypothetical protein
LTAPEARACTGARLPYACFLPIAPVENAVGQQRAPDDPPFMAEALDLSARIPRRRWPNPSVGAVVVRDNRVVGRGAHHGAGAYSVLVGIRANRCFTTGQPVRIADLVSNVGRPVRGDRPRA